MFYPSGEYGAVAGLAQQLGNALVVEDLKFKNDKSVTAEFNRMSHGFIRSKFLEHIDRRAAREGVPVIAVKKVHWPRLKN